MSLINDALKKAQRQRTGGPLDAAPMPGGSSGGGSRGASQGMPREMLVLILAGLAAVVVISVVTTVFFLNRKPAPKVAAAPIVAKPAPVAAAAEPSPVIVAPVIVQAPTPQIELPKAIPPATTAKSPVSAAPATATASPVTAAPVPAPSPAAASTGAPAPAAETPAGPVAPVVAELPITVRIGLFLDKVHVTGIRTSATGSKVLMNDKVYRLNDVVDRLLELRLVKIEPDSLTFADAHGATYVKNF